MDFEKLISNLGYSTPNSLLVLSYHNILKEVFCPFQVLVLEDVASLKSGQIVWVDKVFSTKELKMVFEIGGLLYYSQYFNIICI